MKSLKETAPPKAMFIYSLGPPHAIAADSLCSPCSAYMAQKVETELHSKNHIVVFIPGTCCIKKETVIRAQAQTTQAQSKG